MVPEKNLLNRCSAIQLVPLLARSVRRGARRAGWIERFTNLTAWAPLYNQFAVLAMNHTRVALSAWACWIFQKKSKLHITVTIAAPSALKVC